MEIRIVNDSDDFRLIGDIYTRSWQYAYQNIIPKHYLDSLHCDAWHPNQRFTHYIIATDSGLIGTGSTCVSRDSDLPDWAELASIYLLPDSFGKGYGSQLLKTMITDLKQAGYHDLLVWVLDSNTRAKAFYRRNGFTQSDTQKYIDIAEQRLLAIRYTLALR